MADVQRKKPPLLERDEEEDAFATCTHGASQSLEGKLKIPY